MGLAEQIAGVWVANEDMHPATNIWAREYWVKGNISGTFRGHWNTSNGLPPENLLWHFPLTPKESLK
jgi:hypothetical protein